MLAQDEKLYAGARRNAAQALGELGCIEDAVRLLLALAQDKKVEGDVRRDAAQALGKLGKKEPRVALALLELASDKDDSIRNSAYHALKEVVENLRFAEVSGHWSVSDWWKKARMRFLALLGMTERKIANRKSEIINPKSEMEPNESQQP